MVTDGLSKPRHLSRHGSHRERFYMPMEDSERDAGLFTLRSLVSFGCNSNIREFPPFNGALFFVDRAVTHGMPMTGKVITYLHASTVNLQMSRICINRGRISTGNACENLRQLFYL